MGCELSYKTEIKINDVFALCVEQVDEILGMKFDEY